MGHGSCRQGLLHLDNMHQAGALRSVRRKGRRGYVDGMAIPGSNDELVAAITNNFNALLFAIDSVPTEARSKVTMRGHQQGTSMSPSDLIAYLIGWNSLVLDWLDQDDRGEEVSFPAEGFKWNQLGELATKFYDDYADMSFEDKCNKLTDLKDAIVGTVSERTDEELYGASWYRTHTKGRMIQLNTASPYNNARSRIREWLTANP